MTTSTGAPTGLRHLYAGIAVIAGATLLLEIAMTRIFAVVFFNHSAFLIISTALFGFGLSGVVLSITKIGQSGRLESWLTGFALAFAGSIFATLQVVLRVPLQFEDLTAEHPEQFAYLAIYYLALGVPFFFSGMVVALLLKAHAKTVDRLYFFDLLGAGIGCFSVLLVVPWVGGSGAVLVASVLAALSALLFSLPLGGLPRGLSLLMIGATALSVTLAPPLPCHEEKRSFCHEVRLNLVEFSRWSAVSRVDVSNVPGRAGRTLWINGGSNQSEMIPFDGDLDSLTKDPINAPAVYSIRRDADVLIVGPAGGYEVYWALSYEPASITGVELDPVIVDIVQNEYRDLIGGIYNLPNTSIVNDEGRSFVRRSNRKYDIIQQVNNASPQAIASGALNLSETYLLTVEAIDNYLEHLEDDGFLYIRRWGTARLGAVAAAALRERGVERPGDHIVIIREGDAFHEGFYLKKTPLTPKEIEGFERYAKARGYRVHFTPKMADADTPYANMIVDPDGWKQYERFGINVYPTRDDRPFFNHVKKFGLAPMHPDTPAAFTAVSPKYAQSDRILMIILAEAGLLSVVFILLPLWFFKRSGLAVKGRVPLLIYFASLGLGFILIEISLIQKYTLFIGYPSYSVTTVLFSVLVFAGVGSWLSGRFADRIQHSLRFIVAGICLVSLAEIYLTPLLFDALLGLPLTARICVAVLSLAPLGVLLGMPFPLGVRLVDRIASPLVPWVWGINGYCTVIGTVLCVILALMLGFKAVILLACGIYVVGLLAILRIRV